jgi:predicted metal-dependent enzyme (double-stranded beta helix superfamily)
MSKLKATTLALASTLPLLAISLPSQAAMSPYMETALIDVCKAAKSNHLYRYNKTVKSYNLQDKTIALKVMCNGTDIISFAENYGADKTAAKLQNSIGSVQITDVAAITKINVTFEE